MPRQVGTNTQISYTLQPFPIHTHTHSLSCAPEATVHLGTSAVTSHMQSVFNPLFLPHNQESYSPALLPAASAFPRPLFCHAQPCLSLLGRVSTSGSIQTPSFLLRPFPSISFFWTLCIIFWFAILLPASLNVFKCRNPYSSNY